MTRILLRILLLLILLFLVTRQFRRADEKLILSPAKAVYSQGNSPDSIRIQISDQLRKFQAGYSRRDLNSIDEFMQSLYSTNNILILGTMPGEVYPGFDRATRLVKSDWESWGDCRFEIDSANISSSGNVAWFSTRGYVRFDLSRFLVLPLRLTGIMVKEDQKWKFQQQQFQFDIDFTLNLIVILVISIWIIISIIILFIRTVKLIINKS